LRGVSGFSVACFGAWGLLGGWANDGSDTWIGMAFVLGGIALCVQSKT